VTNDENAPTSGVRRVGRNLPDEQDQLVYFNGSTVRWVRPRRPFQENLKLGQGRKEEGIVNTMSGSDGLPAGNDFLGRDNGAFGHYAHLLLHTGPKRPGRIAKADTARVETASWRPGSESPGFPGRRPCGFGEDGGRSDTSEGRRNGSGRWLCRTGGLRLRPASWIRTAAETTTGSDRTTTTSRTTTVQLFFFIWCRSSTRHKLTAIL
jgi:hypothetical protein